MVAGIGRVLQAGRTYSIDELGELFSMSGDVLQGVVSSLSASGRLRPEPCARPLASADLALRFRAC